MVYIESSRPARIAEYRTETRGKRLEGGGRAPMQLDRGRQDIAHYNNWKGSQI